MANKSLTMYFMNAEGKKVGLRVTEVKEDLADTDVSAVMDLIVSKNIFQSNGGDFKLKDSAQISDKTVTDLTVR